MGLQVNMCELFDLPEKVECPQCKKMTSTRLNDFDFECDEPSKGILKYTEYCGICGWEFPVIIKFNAEIEVSW